MYVTDVGIDIRNGPVEIRAPGEIRTPNPLVRRGIWMVDGHSRRPYVEAAKSGSILDRLRRSRTEGIIADAQKPSLKSPLRSISVR
jgi:hypothetical protein